MAEKRYYWLKLHKDFFKRHEIRIIEDMPNGKDYILFYLKLLVESVTHEGNLRFSDSIPYNEQMLATITNTNIDIVKAAMQIFIELKMIEVLDDQTVFMTDVENMIGSESASTIRSRKCRERQKSLQGNDSATLLQQNCNIENRDKSIDIRDKENRDNNITATSVKNKENFDWSNYNEKELTEIYPLNPEYGMTTAEVDMLYKIVNEDALERYLLKVQEYDTKDPFSTIIRWAKQDMNYKGEA